MLLCCTVRVGVWHSTHYGPDDDGEGGGQEGRLHRAGILWAGYHTGTFGECVSAGCSCVVGRGKGERKKKEEAICVKAQICRLSSSSTSSFSSYITYLAVDCCRGYCIV